MTDLLKTKLSRRAVLQAALPGVQVKVGSSSPGRGDDDGEVTTAA